jgi:hypothetical protein
MSCSIEEEKEEETKNAMDCHKICALQKQNHVSVSGASSKSSERPSSLWWLRITNDKTWVYGYKPETKQQSFQWKSSSLPCPYKDRQVHFSTMIVSFDIKGLYIINSCHSAK